MGEDNKDLQTEESKMPPVDAKRASFQKMFEDDHSKEGITVDQAEKADEPEPSSVKEEIVQKTEEAPVVADAVTKAPDGYVRKEALDEERSRRKRLSQRLKELEKQVQDKIASNSKVEPEDDANVLPEAAKWQARVAALEAKLQEKEQSTQQDAYQQQQAELQEKIQSTDEVLKKEGYPGFRLGVHLVDEVLKKQLAEDEIDQVDYMNPEKWKEVYKEHVFKTIASELKIELKKDTMSEKLKAKEQASKVTTAAGIKSDASKAKDDEDRVLTPEEERDEYLKFKKSNRPNMHFQ